MGGGGGGGHVEKAIFSGDNKSRVFSARAVNEIIILNEYNVRAGDGFPRKRFGIAGVCVTAVIFS